MPVKNIRIFIDTNVWFSAFYGSENCQKIIDAHVSGKVKIVVSPFVLAELAKNISKKLPLLVPSLYSFLEENQPEIFPDPEFLPKKLIALISPKDLKIFVSATTAKVRYFVTGNIRDFQREKLGKLTGIKILTPQEAVKALRL